MTKKELLSFLRITKDLASSESKSPYVHSEYSRGLFEGQRKLAEHFIKKLEAEEEIVREEDIEIDREWDGDITFFIDSNNGSIKRVKTIEGSFIYNGTYVCPTGGPFDFAPYYDSGLWVLERDDGMEPEGGYDGFIIKEKFLEK